MSDKSNEDSMAEGQINRRELLKKGGALGAAAVVAGALGGTAKATAGRVSRKSAGEYAMAALDMRSGLYELSSHTVLIIPIAFDLRAAARKVSMLANVMSKSTAISCQFATPVAMKCGCRPATSGSIHRLISGCEL